jgi:hypothetical protein
MRRFVLLLLPLLALWPVRADALSIRDVIELSRAGLGDDVLLALIEVDRSVFPIDTATLKSLKQAGLSDRVIVALVRSARTPPPPLDAAPIPDDPPQAPAPQVIVIDHHDAPVIREVPVAVPVYIPVAIRSGFRQHRDVRSNDGPTVPVQMTVHPQQQPDGRHAKPAEPVYWGWGGTLRPDAWKPK